MIQHTTRRRVPSRVGHSPGTQSRISAGLSKAKSRRRWSACHPEKERRSSAEKPRRVGIPRAAAAVERTPLPNSSMRMPLQASSPTCAPLPPQPPAREKPQSEEQCHRQALSRALREALRAGLVAAVAAAAAAAAPRVLGSTASCAAWPPEPARERGLSRAVAKQAQPEARGKTVTGVRSRRRAPQALPRPQPFTRRRPKRRRWRRCHYDSCCDSCCGHGLHRCRRCRRLRLGLRAGSPVPGPHPGRGPGRCRAQHHHRGPRRRCRGPGHRCPGHRCHGRGHRCHGRDRRRFLPDPLPWRQGSAGGCSSTECR